MTKKCPRSLFFQLPINMQVFKYVSCSFCSLKTLLVVWCLVTWQRTISHYACRAVLPLSLVFIHMRMLMWETDLVQARTDRA